MDRYLNLALIVALVVLPSAFGLLNMNSQMVTSVAAIAIALCFSNLDKLARFKALGFEAELKAVAEKAYAAIDQLKELGLTLSAPIVDELAISGTLIKYIPLKYKLKRVEAIKKSLSSLGASISEIDHVTHTIYDRVAKDHAGQLLRNLRNLNKDREPLLAGLDDVEMDAFDLAGLRRIVADNSLVTSPETEEAFLDFEYFRRTKRLRREDEWQS